MHRNLATHPAAQDVRVANLLGALDRIHHGAPTITDGRHILPDAQMINSAVEARDASGIRAVFARGTVRAAVVPDRMRYCRFPFPREAQPLLAGEVARWTCTTREQGIRPPD